MPRIVFAISSVSDSPKGNLPMVDTPLHIEAESYNGSLGITKQSTTIESTDAGDWIRFDNVNLGTGYNTITTRYAKGNPGNGTAQIRIGNPTTGTLLGTLTTVPTGGWGTFQNVTATLSGATGTQTLYVYWPSGEGNGNFDWFEFSNTGGSTDTTPPSAPANLILASSTATSASLSWTASTDNVGVTLYEVYNSVNGVMTLAGTSSTNVITISNLAANASYLFSVKAKDAASNYSPYSNALPVTLGSLGSLRLEAEAFSGSNGVVKQATTVESTDAGDWIRFDMVNLAGGFSTITTRYARGTTGNGSAQVRLGTLTGPIIATLTTTNTGSWGTYATTAANVTGGTGGQTIYITWPSGLGNGNFDWFEFSGSQSGIDTTPPTAPTNLTLVSKTSTSMSLSWTASTDNVGVTEYQVYQTRYGNLEYMGASASNTITLSNLSSNNSYNISVLARDAANNRSTYSSTIGVTLSPAINIHLEAENFNGMNGISKQATYIENTDAGDWIRFDNVTLGKQYNTFGARYAKGNSAEGTTQIRLGSITGPVIGTLTTEPTAGWDAFTQGYATLNAPDGPQTLYVYWPSNGIKGENNGSFDSFDFFETIGGPDIIPPTTPTNLTLVSNTQNTVTLKWDPSSDNFSGVRYVVYNTINQVVAQSDVNSATFTGLQATLPYVFTVRAVDGFSNFSGYSNPINVLLSNSPTHLEAESFSRSNGIVKQATTVESTDAGDWISFDLLDLGTGYSTITTRYAKGNASNGTAQIRVGNPITGTVIGTLTTPPTGGWGTYKTASTTLINSSGVQTVYVSWPAGEGNGNYDWFEFSGTASGVDVTPPTTPTNLVISSYKPIASLSWTPSTDNVGVTLYEIYNNGTELMGTTTSNGFGFEGINKWFTVTVRAKDAANNYSPFSTSVNFGWSPLGGSSFHLEAEAFDASSGISKQLNTVESTDAGDWIRFENIYTYGYSTMQVRYAKGNPGNGKAELRLGSTTGTLVGTITTAPTGGWGTYTTSNISVNLPSGPQTLYIYWPAGEGNGNFDWFEFTFVTPSSTARQDMSIAAETPSPLSASPIEDEEVTENKLYQNFPNPFSGSTEIGVSLKRPVKAANITVTDLTGRSLQQVGIVERGNVPVKVEGNNMRAGIYIYSLMVDGQVVDMKRMAVFE